MQYLPVSERPTVLQFQFLNQEKSYKRDVLPIEDADRDLNDPNALGAPEYVLETVERNEVTDPSQLERYERPFRRRAAAMRTAAPSAPAPRYFFE